MNQNVSKWIQPNNYQLHIPLIINQLRAKKNSNYLVFNRIRGYNAINIKNGYIPLDIRSPKDIIINEN